MDFSCNDFNQFSCHLVKVARVAEPLLAHRAGERQLPGVDEPVLGQVLRVPVEGVDTFRRILIHKVVGISNKVHECIEYC